jgi:uncharacterized iron-regulated membrane protein
MIEATGSMPRRVLFWMHLATGLTAGVLILVMSVTGVLLTYEHQMIEAAARRNQVDLAPGAQRLTADELATIARANLPADAKLTLIVDARPTEPVAIGVGRDTALLLHPISGAVIADAAAPWRSAFGTIERWHRWLGGEPRSTGAHLMDAANLMFLFLVISGSYLWLPAVWRWRTVRGLLLTQRRYVNSRARDFNWHHVASAWMLVPLLLITTSGVVISYGWASKLVYAAFGESPPLRPGQPGAGTGGPGGSPPAEVAATAARAPVQALLAAASEGIPDWQRLTLPLDGVGERVSIAAEVASSGARPQRRSIVLSIADASVLQASVAGPPPSAGQRARVWLRFVHTGEQYGLIGQTLAGLASLAACLLVYTGIALAWRRFFR